MRCTLCRRPLDEIHGHMACLSSGCPMYGVNQGECCSGETADGGWIATSDIASPGCSAGRVDATPAQTTERAAVGPPRNDFDAGDR